MPAVVSGPMVRNHGAERMWGRGLLSCGGPGAGRQGQDTLFKSKTVSEDHHAGVQERSPFTCLCSGAKEERMNFAAVLWKGGSSPFWSPPLCSEQHLPNCSAENLILDKFKILNWASWWAREITVDKESEFWKQLGQILSLQSKSFLDPTELHHTPSPPPPIKLTNCSHKSLSRAACCLD